MPHPTDDTETSKTHFPPERLDSNRGRRNQVKTQRGIWQVVLRWELQWEFRDEKIKKSFPGSRQAFVAKVGFEFGLGEWAGVQKRVRKISQVNIHAYLKRKLQMEAIVTNLSTLIISKEVQNENKWQGDSEMAGLWWERWAE